MKNFIAVDLAHVYADPDKERYLRTLAWGDRVEVLEKTDKYLKVQVTQFDEKTGEDIMPETVTGYIVPSKASKKKPDDIVAKPSKNNIVKINFVDVQQGDGMVIETPAGNVLLVDGGDNQLFARYLACRFRNTTLQQPQEVAGIVVTHGDADHFSGLVKILESETHKQLHKRLFMRPRRIYHNGLVKRPGDKDGHDRPEIELLGPTQAVGGKTYAIGLEDDLLKVPVEEMNEPFKAWQNALKTYDDRLLLEGAKLEFRRLAKGDATAFSFLTPKDNCRVEVLGPMPVKIGDVEGLPFLSKPPGGPNLGMENASGATGKKGSLSASHTINGHSVVLRLTCGGFSYLFGGDLNAESGQSLVKEHQAGKLMLTSDVLKVPHHGSADYCPPFLEAVAPLVSVISSGDESERKEYIHPRANLLAALGRYSRGNAPVIFVTELVAFFKKEGYVEPEHHVKKGSGWAESAGAKPTFFAFRRTAFGCVKTRTDGQRLLVYTNSGQDKLKEAYAFVIGASGKPEPAAVCEV